MLLNTSFVISMLTLRGPITAENRSKSLEKNLDPHLNQSATKDTALSTKEDPDQTMDGFRLVAAHKSTINYVEIQPLDELDPSK
jgi:hypothetical protein